MPAGRNLPSDKGAEMKRLRNLDKSPFLELNETLLAFFRPDVALVAMLVLELLGLLLRDLNGFEVMDELNLLIIDLLLRIISVVQLRLCVTIKSELGRE